MASTASGVCWASSAANNLLRRSFTSGLFGSYHEGNRSLGTSVFSEVLLSTAVVAMGLRNTYSLDFTSSELVLAIGPEFGAFGVYFGAEVPQDDERFDVAGVFEGDAGFGGVLCAEDFVAGELVEAD